MTTGLLKMAGISVQDSHAWRYKLNQSRMEAKKKANEKFDEKDEYAIVKVHDIQIGEAGHSIEALDKNEKVTS